MKKIFFLFMAAVLLLLSVGTAAASSGGGIHDGVYLIYDAEDLVAFSDYVNSDITHVATDARLMADVDMMGSWVGIGTTSQPYAGTFDGNSKCISNLYYSGSLNYYFVYGLVSSAIVTNTHFKNCTLLIRNTGDTVFIRYVLSVSNCIFDHCTFHHEDINSRAGAYTSIIQFCDSVHDCIIIGGSLSSKSVSTGYNSAYAFSFIGDVSNIYIKLDNYTVDNGNYASVVSSDYRASPVSVAGVVSVTETYRTVRSSSYSGTYLYHKYGNPSSISDAVFVGARNYQLSPYNVVKSSGTTSLQITGTADSRTGAPVTAATATTRSFYEDILGWDFDDVWYWDSVENLPKLQAFATPVVTDFQRTSDPYIGHHIGATDTTIRMSVTAYSVGTLSYAWYWSHDDGETWQLMRTTTTPTANYDVYSKPSGRYLLKCIATDIMSGKSVDTYDIGYTNVTETLIGYMTFTSVAVPERGDLASDFDVVVRGKIENYGYQNIDILFDSFRELGGTRNTTFLGAGPSTFDPETGDFTMIYHLRVNDTGTTGSAHTYYYHYVARDSLVGFPYKYYYRVQQQDSRTYTTYTTGVKPILSQQPTAAPAVGKFRQDVSLSITGVTGAAPITYQWQEQIGSTWRNITGAVSAASTVSVSDSAETIHTYRVIASNDFGSTISGTTTYHSYASPVIVSVTVPNTVIVGSQFTFSAVTQYATSVKYQISANQASWTDITSPHSIQAEGTYYFRVAASNPAYTIYSSVYTIDAGYVPAITGNPTITPAVGPLNQIVSVSISGVTGTAPITYQWQEQIGSTWRNIPSAASASSTISVSDDDETLHTYRVFVSNRFGSASSASVTYHSYHAPDIIHVNLPDSVYINVPFEFSAVTEHATTVTYQISYDNLIWTSITSPHTITKSGQYYFRVIASNPVLTTTSPTYTVIAHINHPRPMATATMTAIPTTAISNITAAFDVDPGEYPDFKQALKAVVDPIEGELPDGFLFVIVFGVIFLMLWLITKNTAVPSIIGLIFGSTILALFPASYYGPAIVILAISIAGGIYRVFQPPK